MHSFIRAGAALLLSPLYLVLGLVVLVLAWVVYNLTLSPLARIPGPHIPALTNWWLVYHSRLLHRSAAVKNLHDIYGPVVRVAPNHVSFSDPSALKVIYGHKPIFEKGPFYDALRVEKQYGTDVYVALLFHQGGPTIFSARNSQFHNMKRKYLNPGFQPRALHAYEGRMKDDIRTLKSAFLARTAHGETTLDFNAWAKYFAFDVIANYGFGASFGFMQHGHKMIDLMDVLDKRGETMQAFGTVPDYAKPFMKYLFFDKFWSDGLAAKTGLQKFGQEAFERRRDSFDPENPDLLSLLFNAKLPNGEQLPEKEIISDAIAFIIGGSDAPSIAMAHFMDLVSRDTKLQARLQLELDEHFPGPLPDEWVAPDSAMHDLPLLGAALKESQRLIPTSSTGLERVVPKGGADIAGHYFPEGTLVSVLTTAVTHDPLTYNNPDAFEPDRWLVEDPSKLNENFHPFSLGPRSCIGRSFAWMEMTMCLATLLRTFTFERTKVEPTNMREAFTLKPEECWVVIRPRK